jgi:hypothetical protein
MREIKFRAWDTRAGGWVVNTQIFSQFPTDTNGELQPVAPWFEVMQFTGLKDKNGKEIYEGDILENPKGSDGPASIVKWDEEGAYFHVFRGETSSGYTLQGEVSRAVVIGNIYENPELLKP